MCFVDSWSCRNPSIAAKQATDKRAPLKTSEAHAARTSGFSFPLRTPRREPEPSQRFSLLSPMGLGGSREDSRSATQTILSKFSRIIGNGSFNMKPGPCSFPIGLAWDPKPIGSVADRFPSCSEFTSTWRFRCACVPWCAQWDVPSLTCRVRNVWSRLRAIGARTSPSDRISLTTPLQHGNAPLWVYPQSGSPPNVLSW